MCISVSFKIRKTHMVLFVAGGLMSGFLVFSKVKAKDSVLLSLLCQGLGTVRPLVKENSSPN